MPAGGMTKAQGRRHSKLKGHYERQYFVTTRNKVRRKQRTARRRAVWLKRGLKKNGRAVKA